MGDRYRAITQPPTPAASAPADASPSPGTTPIPTAESSAASMEETPPSKCAVDRDRESPTERPRPQGRQNHKRGGQFVDRWRLVKSKWSTQRVKM